MKYETRTEEPIPELGGLTAREAEEKLEKWFRYRAQRKGCEAEEKKLKREFKSFDLDTGKHIVGRQSLRVSPGGRSDLDLERLIETLREEFGSEFDERFLKLDPEGDGYQNELRAEFFNDLKWKSYTPLGRDGDE